MQKHWYAIHTYSGHAPIRVRAYVTDENGQVTRKMMDSTAGRIIFMNLFPEGMRYTEATNREIDKKAMGEVVAICHRKYGSASTIKLLDEMKALGYKYATISGVTVAMIAVRGAVPGANGGLVVVRGAR